ERATEGFMVQNQRRPYPSDISLNFTHPNFGREITPPADYSVAINNHFAETVSPASTSCTADSNSMTITSSPDIMNSWMVKAAAGVRAQSQVAMRNDTTPLLDKKAIAACPNARFRNPLVTGGVPTRALE